MCALTINCSKDRKTKRQRLSVGCNEICWALCYVAVWGSTLHGCVPCTAVLPVRRVQDAVMEKKKSRRNMRRECALDVSVNCSISRSLFFISDCLFMFCMSVFNRCEILLAAIGHLLRFFFIQVRHFSETGNSLTSKFHCECNRFRNTIHAESIFPILCGFRPENSHSTLTQRKKTLTCHN